MSPLEAVVGQPQAVMLLQQSLAQRRIAPGYLFLGPDGVGKARAAIAYAEHLLSPNYQPSASVRRRIEHQNHPDLLWVEPTYLHQSRLLTAAEAAATGLKRRARPQIRLRQIRQVGQYLSRPPLESPRAVVVIEAADQMAEAAANGLLKTLEEPGRATLILLAANPQGLLPTLISRCQTIPFVRLGTAQLSQVLTTAGHANILQQPEVLAMAQGSPGAAIACFEQLQALPPDLLSHLAQPPVTVRDALTAARQITQTLDTEAQLWLLDYLQQRYWQTQALSPAALQQLETARQHLQRFVQPRLVWEVTLMALAQTA